MNQGAAPVPSQASAVRDRPGFPFWALCPANEDTPYALSLKNSTDANAVHPCGIVRSRISS